MNNHDVSSTCWVQPITRQRFNSEFLIYLSFPNILNNYVCFVVSYLSVFLRARIFDELVGKLVIKKPRNHTQ